MPIKLENRKLYPRDWKQIRERILERASNKTIKESRQGVVLSNLDLFPELNKPAPIMRNWWGNEQKIYE